VPVGNYVALFYNCGANTGGAVNPNYVDIFYGNTYVPAKATKFAVTKNATTSLGTNPIPLGGTISGTVTDSTLGGPAIYSPPVGIRIPGAEKLNLDSTQGWYIACANSKGKYTIHGVPTGGVNVVFAPTSWGCVYNSSGDYNFGFYNQSESGTIQTTVGGTNTVNGSVTEGPDYPSIRLPLACRGGASKRRSGAPARRRGVQRRDLRGRAGDRPAAMNALNTDMAAQPGAGLRRGRGRPWRPSGGAGRGGASAPSASAPT
jgi:hypothetical protein